MRPDITATGPFRYWVRDWQRRLRWQGEGLEPCYYCGLPADTIDHVVPQTLLDRLPELHCSPTLEADTVPACRECNTGLGPRFYNSLAERKEAAHDYLRRRYRKLIEMPDWSDAELADLADGHLKNYVRASIALRAELLRRLRW